MCLKEICELAIDHYANNCTDIRKCPNQNCKHFGIIPVGSCADSLECEGCGHRWRDISNYSVYESVMKVVKDTLHLNSDVFSTLHALLFEEPCPRCGVLIQKNGGCKHMVCGKCKHEFCWLCLGSYYSYCHGENSFCPFRQTALVGSLVLVFIFLHQKLVY